MSGHRSAPLLIPFLIASLLGACGKHDDTAGDEATASTTGSDVALPKPQATGGSVTGMPAKPDPIRSGLYRRLGMKLLRVRIGT